MTSTELTANPRKTTGVRHLGLVDVAALRDAVLALDEAVWLRENAEKPNRVIALDRTQHVVFKFISGPYDWRISFERPLWQEWLPLLEPVLRQATAAYGYANGEFPRVMLARMPAGEVIKPHRDSAPAARWPHKIHVPLLTNPDVRFYVEPNEYHLEVGQAYEVNNLGVHAVRNGGAEPRVHLIFEYYDRDQPVI
jgi:hypothetical protein